ncbi:hypothetical protein F5888DRAFT_1658734 [Russula emetica]|nr:hypothetical protein F5888DRAFT_1658734 [Russula emetica]
MPPQRHIISAFRALPTSLPRSRRSVLVFATFLLCTLTITVTTTSEAQTTAQSARPDALFPYPSNEHGDYSCPQAFTVSVKNARAALEAVSVLVLRYISPVVHRRAAVARAATTSGSHNPPISNQALTAIILCSAIVFCVLVGCLLQLPAAYISLRNRYFRSGRAGTPTPSSSNSMPGLFDVEMGGGSLNCSPPPPYSRAPSYDSESSRDRDNNTSTGGRGECQSTS